MDLVAAILLKHGVICDMYKLPSSRGSATACLTYDGNYYVVLLEI